MKTEKRGKLNRWLLACMMIVLALALCGCRTRLTNNTEVSDSIVDEDGWLMEDYQYRRDEIGSPVAKKPFITGGGDQEDEYEGEIYGEYQGEVDDEEDEEDEDDDDIETETDTVSTSTGTSSTGSSTSTTTTRRSSTTTRKTTSTTKKSSTTTKKTTTTKVTVTFNANGGKVASGSSLVSSTTKSYEVGATIGSFPSAVWNGHELLGWYSAASGGTKVETTAKVSEKITLYAQWDPPTEKKEYNIAWNLNGATTEDAMPTKGSALPNSLPVAKKKDYHFNGWVDKDGKPVSGGQALSGDMELKADFDFWYDTWRDAKQASDVVVAIDGFEDGFTKVDNNNKWEAGTPAKFVIIDGGKNNEKADERAEEKRKESDDFKNATIIAIPSEAKDNDNQIYYRLLLLNLVYGEELISDEQLNSAYADAQITIPKEKDKQFKLYEPSVAPPDPAQDPNQQQEQNDPQEQNPSQEQNDPQEQDPSQEQNNKQEQDQADADEHAPQNL